MVVFSQCLDCKNYTGINQEKKYTCKAFPAGITEDIFCNRINHDKNADGDNNIKFESIEGSISRQIEK